MKKQQAKIDSVRASRDGHEYHEMWVAQHSLQLLWEESELHAIAVEGVSPSDHGFVNKQAIEIADVTLYYGSSSFSNAKAVEIVQLKHSTSHPNKEFRAADAKKIIERFAQTYCDYKKKFGARAVHNKLSFKIVTNRPIYKPLMAAIQAVAKKQSASGQDKTQATQLRKAVGLTGEDLAVFASKLHFVGQTGDVTDIKTELSIKITDWSASNASFASMGLGSIKEMVRKKCGAQTGPSQNLIIHTDVLNAFEVSDSRDLLPCPNNLVEHQHIVKRKQIPDAVDLLKTKTKILLIHAAGGVGKTVFMQSLADAMKAEHEVIFFDCFAGGLYRSPEDARHLPKKGLVHIANTLSIRGLCGPILPRNYESDDLLQAFRRRVEHSIASFQQCRPKRQLFLFIDAADNAEIIAKNGNEKSFPVLLMESLHHNPIEDFKLIVSCRTERKPDIHAHIDDFLLRPFTIEETGQYLRSVCGEVSTSEIQTAQAQTMGNPRVLENLLQSEPNLLDETGNNKVTELNDILKQRIDDALKETKNRGASQEEINTFLAGLAVLPPPIPLQEHADAHGLPPSAITSFVSDLSPLLEQTIHGIIFRDEPIETYVRDKYASNKDVLKKISQNLWSRQKESIYAARTLPTLLRSLNDGDQLYKLAFEKQLPDSAKSAADKREIRHARIKAAVTHAAENRDYNKLVDLLVELSRMVSVNAHGAEYIFENPDLAIAAQDANSIRRLFEMSTRWRGGRHARLAIANTLAKDSDEAVRHAKLSEDWTLQYLRERPEHELSDAIPKEKDLAAAPFFLICERAPETAASYIDYQYNWYDWYKFEVCKHIFNYAHLAIETGALSSRILHKVIDSMRTVGSVSAALSFYNCPKQLKRGLIGRLAKLCKKQTKLQISESSYTGDRRVRMQDGLLRSAAIALQLGLYKEAQIISLRAGPKHPRIYSVLDSIYTNDAGAFLIRTALLAAAKQKPVHEKDLLPDEWAKPCSKIKRTVTGIDFRRMAMRCIDKHIQASEKQDEQKDKQHVRRQQAIRENQKQKAERFLEERLPDFVQITSVLSNIQGTSSSQIANKEFKKFLNIWSDLCDGRHYRQDSMWFFKRLGFKLVTFVLWSRYDLSLSSVDALISFVLDRQFSTDDLISIVNILARRRKMRGRAEMLALKSRELIKTENDVSRRGELFANLSRAIFPASLDEAAEYYQNGLEQMEAISSGDYSFTNELFLYASDIKGQEMKVKDFHTLSNIGELNMTDDTDKFIWGAFSRGMSRVSGAKGLAKLSRWDDRSKPELKYSLLPYLIALLADGKVKPSLAVALNYLADPPEYHDFGTRKLASVISEKLSLGDKPSVCEEVIKQFQCNNPDTLNVSMLKAFNKLASKDLGASHKMTAHLHAAQKHFSIINDAAEGQSIHRYGFSPAQRNKVRQAESNAESLVAEIIKNITPHDYDSLTEGIIQFEKSKVIATTWDNFFTRLRKKVTSKHRTKYILNLCAVKDIWLRWKLDELELCKEKWKNHSASLSRAYRNSAAELIRKHAYGMSQHDWLSGGELNRISKLTGAPHHELAIELITVYSRSEADVSGAVWMTLAGWICRVADPNAGQRALERLLQGQAAELANNVVDGPWKDGLYPKGDDTDIYAGLIWRVLGSPHAESRWRAAHCLRCLAKFGHWPVIDSVVARIADKTAGPFQAQELKFYYLHARLWLLIALARLAVDYPQQIAKYKKQLLDIVTHRSERHVLCRHFASDALICCIKNGGMVLTPEEEQAVRSVNKSPHPLAPATEEPRADSYGDRRQTEPKPEPSYKFYIDYDFRKEDIDPLGQVFWQHCWKIEDKIAGISKSLDAEVTSMNDYGGREQDSGRRYHRGISLHHHKYGEYVGWHAMFLCAGDLLEKHPVVKNRWNDENEWDAWLHTHKLSREDGYWLSDGMDSRPLEVVQMLLETGRKQTNLTGDEKKIRQLAGLENGVKKEIVVQGRWRSADERRGVGIEISSALVAPERSSVLARKLIREKPLIIHLPSCRYEDEKICRSDERDYTPWLVLPSVGICLDQEDPYGVSMANMRPLPTLDIRNTFSLLPTDRFGRSWQTPNGKFVFQAEVWGAENSSREGGPYSGSRLVCSSAFLKKILKKYKKDLLILIKLEKHDEGIPRYEENKYTHSVAVISISQSMEVTYYKGKTNHLHVSDYY